MTAAWAPKLVLRTSEAPYRSKAQETRSAAEAPDRLRFAAVASTAGVKMSAVVII
jgi:hypothetical protein